ncbi:MAG TPA: ABC transporter permease [Candidatus Atribacteria bacterium]|nr:ABC transporter permease [Candidatus Atribacteria bacterium]
MYWKYCIKRIIYGLAIFIVLIFIYSALFNTTMESTLRSQIEEEIHAETMRLDTRMTPEELTRYINERREFKQHLYHLDKPIWKRIVWRALNVLSLNFGKATIIRSSAGESDVWTIIAECLPRTVLLFTTAIFINIILGLWLGIKKAQKAGELLDKTTSIGTMIVYGMPSWWLGMLVIMFFAYTIRIFPSGGLHSIPPPTGLAYYTDLFYHMTLPVLTLVIIGFWGSAFLIRNIVLSILQEDYIMAARTRGIPERKVLYGHAMRTAAPPIVTMALLSLLASVGGNIIFEGIFSWPGLGNLYWISIEQNDIPVLMGNLFVTTALYIGGLVILDLIYGFLDPRIKVGGKQ